MSDSLRPHESQHARPPCPLPTPGVHPDSTSIAGGSDHDNPQEKEVQKGKWLSVEALQKGEKRREAKGKGEKERYIHLNAEFQSIARKDNKAFLSDQCKEIEENNRIGKTRDLFKKIRDTKGTLHAKIGTIKDRNRRY